MVSDNKHKYRYRWHRMTAQTEYLSEFLHMYYIIIDLKFCFTLFIVLGFW